MQAWTTKLHTQKVMLAFKANMHLYLGSESFDP